MAHGYELIAKRKALRAATTSIEIPAVSRKAEVPNRERFYFSEFRPKFAISLRLPHLLNSHQKMPYLHTQSASIIVVHMLDLGINTAHALMKQIFALTIVWTKGGRTVMQKTEFVLAEHATMPLRTRATCFLIKRGTLNEDPSIEDSQSSHVLNALSFSGISLDERTYRAWWYGSNTPRSNPNDALEQLVPGCYKYLQLENVTSPINRHLRALDRCKVGGELANKNSLEETLNVMADIFQVIQRVWEVFYSPRYRPYDDALDMERQAPDLPLLEFFEDGVTENRNCTDLPMAVRQTFDPGSELGLLKFLIALGIHSMRTRRTKLLKALSMDLATLIHCMAANLQLHKITLGRPPEDAPEWNELTLLLNAFFRSDENYPAYLDHYCKAELSNSSRLQADIEIILHKAALSGQVREVYFDQLREIGISQRYFLDTLGLDQQKTAT